MSKKFYSLFVEGLMLLLLVGSQSLAAGCQKKIALNATSAGFAIGASGTAEVRARDAQQRFKVSIDANVADGTTFAVFANGSLAGTITIALGAGELDLNNNNGNVLPSGVDPVCKISGVEVRDGSGSAILQGSF